jgi:hypothetical protein
LETSKISTQALLHLRVQIQLHRQINHHPTNEQKEDRTFHKLPLIDLSAVCNKQLHRHNKRERLVEDTELAILLFLNSIQTWPKTIQL